MEFYIVGVNVCRRCISISNDYISKVMDRLKNTGRSRTGVLTFSWTVNSKTLRYTLNEQ
jgi:hypothetical protein